tara:strand:+ start:1218 stop:1406 length:189 start_codon:yes stop_codon:yes gene_type:complete
MNDTHLELLANLELLATLEDIGILDENSNWRKTMEDIKGLDKENFIEDHFEIVHVKDKEGVE